MHVLTYVSLITTMLFWGGTFIAGRVLAENIAPVNASFLRFFIASLALLIMTRLLEGRLVRPEKRQLLPILLLGLTGVYSYNVFFFTGLHYISAGRAALIIATTPLVISLLAVVFLKEKLTLAGIGGILLSLSGALLVISNGDPSLLLHGGFGPGEKALLGCVLSWALYTLIGRTVITTLSPLTAVCYSSIAGTLLLFIPALQKGLGQELTRISVTDWFGLAYLGICGTALGFSWYYRGIKKIGTTSAGVFINLVPFFGVVLAWLLLDEALKAIVLIGGILILSGVATTNMASRRAAATTLSHHKEKETICEQ